MADDVPRLPRRNRSCDDPKMIGLWKIGRTIGTGAQGRVRIARHSVTGQYAAVKIITKFPGPSQLEQAGIGPEGIQHSVEREIVIMKLIDHPNILRLYDVWETSTDLYLILEYVEGGELFDYLCNKGRLSTSEALGYFQQLISAVHYCHQFNIAHRDLKPENLLLDVNKNIKVADFGLAAYGANDGLLNTFCGSPHYAAPEVISGQIYNGSCSDTWSCGIILHALLIGKLPFEAEDCDILKQQILRAEFSMPSDVDPLARDLVSKMLERDVTKRITIPEVIKHPFYISRPPKALDRAVPSLEAIARPIDGPASIDPDIFCNLRTLWPGTPGTEITRCLLNDEKNWQKGIYHLLVEYRLRHLENYDEEEQLLKQREARRRRQVKKTRPPVEEIQQAVSTPRVPDMSCLPPRAAPPTPRRASRQQGGSVTTLNEPASSQNRLQAETRLSATSPTSPQSPVWAALNLPPLDVPELEDEKMQQFFHQIVEHLNVMQQRALIMGGMSPVPARTSILPQHELGSETQEPAPIQYGGCVAATERRNEGVGNRIFMPSRNLNRLGVSDENDDGTKPLAIRRAKRPAIRLPLSRAEKENEVDDEVLNVEKVKKKSSLKKYKERALSGNRKVKIVEPEVIERGRLRKKSLGTPSSPAPPSDSGPGSGFSPVLPSPSSVPKRTWFDSVFRIKPAMYQMLSTYDAQTAGIECRRLLMGLGAQVMLTQAEGLGVLKCRLNAVQDPTGSMAVSKTVKFRVEMHGVEPGRAEEGYAVALHFILEKGAGSAFRMVYEKVSSAWADEESGLATTDRE